MTSLSRSIQINPQNLRYAAQETLVFTSGFPLCLAKHWFARSIAVSCRQ